MNRVEIKSYKTHKILFSGYYSSVTECIEDAVTQKVDLSFADLSNQNLSNGNFDGAKLSGALMSGANLTGANFSESNLQNVLFTDTSLYNTCFCYSDLSASNFKNASFGATDIAGCDLRECEFSTLSCFSLDFTSIKTMHGSTYHSSNGTLCAMSSRPIVMNGILNSPIIIMDHVTKIGHRLFPKEMMWHIPMILKHSTENGR